jgi:hypothetical protein
MDPLPVIISTGFDEQFVRTSPRVPRIARVAVAKAP